MRITVLLQGSRATIMENRNGTNTQDPYSHEGGTEDVIVWMRSKFYVGNTGSLAKSQVYNEYKAYCISRNWKPSSPAGCGRLVHKAFPNITCVRKGGRKTMQYHYKHLCMHNEVIGSFDTISPVEADYLYTPDPPAQPLQHNPLVVLPEEQSPIHSIDSPIDPSSATPHDLRWGAHAQPITPPAPFIDTPGIIGTPHQHLPYSPPPLVSNIYNTLNPSTAHHMERYPHAQPQSVIDPSPLYPYAQVPRWSSLPSYPPTTTTTTIPFPLAPTMRPRSNSSPPSFAPHLLQHLPQSPLVQHAQRAQPQQPQQPQPQQTLHRPQVLPFFPSPTVEMLPIDEPEFEDIETLRIDLAFEEYYKDLERTLLLGRSEKVKEVVHNFWQGQMPGLLSSSQWLYISEIDRKGLAMLMDTLLSNPARLERQAQAVWLSNVACALPLWVQCEAVSTMPRDFMISQRGYLADFSQMLYAHASKL